MIIFDVNNFLKIGKPYETNHRAFAQRRGFEPLQAGLEAAVLHVTLPMYLDHSIGLEPIQLEFVAQSTSIMLRVDRVVWGIEPSFTDSQSVVLPLN